jgi:hypothetical protein
MTGIMPRMSGRRAAALAAAAITLLVPALSMAGPAAAQPTAPAQTVMPITAGSTDWICDPGNTTEDCWGPDPVEEDEVGDDVEDGYDTGHAVNEASVLLDSGSCNDGRVTSTCPFAASTGLNNDLINHTIVEVVFDALCMDSVSAIYLELDDCTGSHAAYVIVDGGYALVSVGASNAAESVDGPNNPELVVADPGGGGDTYGVRTLDQAIAETSSDPLDTWLEGN